MRTVMTIQGLGIVGETQRELAVRALVEAAPQVVERRRRSHRVRIEDLGEGRALDRVQLSKYFFYPPLIMLSLAVIYTVIIGTFVVGI